MADPTANEQLVIGSADASLNSYSWITGDSNVNVYITSKISIGGHANLTNSLYVGDKITVGGGNYVLPSAIGSAGYALKVPTSGNVLEWGEVISTTGTTFTLSQTLSVNGETTLSSTLLVKSATTINDTLKVDSATVIAKTLSVGGHANLTGSLLIGGNISLYGGKYMLPNTFGNPYDALIVPSSGKMLEWGEASSTSGTSLSLLQTLIVNGASTLNSTLKISKATTLAETLSVSGDSVMSNLTTSGIVTINGQLKANGGISTDGTKFTVDDITGNVQTQGKLTVAGESSLATLTTSGATTFGSTLKTDGATTLAGSLAITGATTLNNTFSVSVELLYQL